MKSCADIIRDRAATVVRAVRADEVGVYRMIKGLVATTIQDYRGRFLHEMIQNGFDAHPPDRRDGMIAVVFNDDEGDHGVLYVANGGRPLTESNFLRMASLGDSDKDIGVGIGNKGVGFKSVFQICDAPQVYSANGPGDKGFNGFSFRFGTPHDLDRHIEIDDPDRAKVERELSLSLLTVPLDGSLAALPPAVAALRTDGYATVLRLPAASERAAEEIVERLDRLIDSPTPVMLFLDRLASVTITSSSGSEPTVLTRDQVAADGLTRVILNGDERYLLFEEPVAQHDLRSALAEAVEEGSLDVRWLEWTAPATVSVAVGDGWAIPNPGAFTFLPMSASATSPLGGHINAPFVTDYARLGLNLEQPVNRLMMRRIAEVCIVGVSGLVASQQNPGAVVDLVAWSEEAIDWIDNAAQHLNGTIIDNIVRLPAIGRTEWQPLGQLVAWPDQSCGVVTIDALVGVAGATLIDAAQFESQQHGRLEGLKHDGSTLAPAPETVAEWVESIAADLADRKAPISTWGAFYDDLPQLFPSGESLYGRRILLAESGDLVPADQPPDPASEQGGARKRRASVYFAPKTTGSDDDDAVETDLVITPPASVKRRILFLHHDLEWYVRSQQTPGRKFLQDQRLARPFRTAALLTQLGQLMAANPSDAVKRDSLLFAFRLFASNPTRHSKELAAARLMVPTITGGWVAAPRAFFSAGWAVAGAQELSDIVAGAPNESSELARLGASLVVGPADLFDADEDVKRWVEFLKVLGLRATLPIFSVSDNRTIRGRSLRAETIAGSGAPDALTAVVREQWAAGISALGNENHPETDFSTKDPAYWFAGQGEIADLSTRLRLAYSRLVILTASSITEQQRFSTWTRLRGGGWTTTIETPLWSFLTTAEWLPLAVPGERDRVFASPSESWYVGREDEMAASYSPLIDSRVRRLMETVDGEGRQWKRLGILDWTEQHDAARLIDHLTDIFQGGDVPETAIEHFRSSLAWAWNCVGNPDVKTRPLLDHALLVDVEGRLELRAKDHPNPGRIFVAGSHDQSSTTRLVRELGWPLVIVDSEDPVRLNEVTSVLQAFWQEEVSASHDWELKVLVDDVPWTVDQNAPRLLEEIPWAGLLLAATMRFPRASGMRVGRQLARALDDLGRVRIVRAETVAIASHTGSEPLPARLRGVLPLEGAVPTMLVASPGSATSWGEFEILMQAALELLGYQRFKAEVTLTIRDLSTGADQIITRPSVTELAHVLEASRAQIIEVETVVFGVVSGIIDRLRLVGPALWGERALYALSEERTARYSRDDVLHALAELCGNDDEANRVLDAATDAPSADELRRQLGVSIIDYNQALATYFPTSPRVDNGAAQAEEFNLRCRQRRTELVDWLRNVRAARFAARDTQPDWIDLRRLDFLTPDSKWATALDDVDTAAIDERIDALMTAAVGARVVLEAPLPELETVNSANGRRLRTRIIEARRVVRAWCARERAAVPVAWEAESFDEDIRGLLDQAGALDFRELSNDDLASWLERIGVWPTGMTLSVDSAPHSLADDDLASQETEEASAKAAKARAARTVKYQGVEVDLEASMSDLVDRVSTFLGTGPGSLMSAYRTSSLAEVTAAKSKSGARAGVTGKTRAGGVANRPSQEQTSAIGLVGEMLAYHWLKVRDPSQAVDPSCWKSGNCRFVFEGSVGDDGLGYDFEVPRSGPPVMYEVKATTGDAGMIELGETEVRCAQQFARTDRWRLLIVEDALSPAPRIHLLPNPFSPDSRSLFRFEGNSVRLRFSLG